MQNQPILTYKKNGLELHIWYPINRQFNVGNQLIIQTADGARWPITVSGTRSLGMNLCLTLQLTADSPDVFIKCACASLQSTRLIKSHAKLLDRNGSLLEQYPSIEVHP